MFVKGIQEMFKYHLQLVELYFREEWIEKSFVLNITHFIVDIIIMGLNARVFIWIMFQGHFPMYLMGECIDTLHKLHKSFQLFLKQRTLIEKLNKLPDINMNEQNGMDNQCIICLQTMVTAKKLKCGHVFHLRCVKGWIEKKSSCPACRSTNVLDNDNPALNIPAPQP